MNVSESVIVNGGMMMNLKVNFKHVTVTMSDGSVRQGKVNIRSFKRLSDFLRNKYDDFIILIPDGSAADSIKVLLNKDYVSEVEETVEHQTIRSVDRSTLKRVSNSRR